MKRLLAALMMTTTVLVLGACSSDDDVVVPPNIDIYTAQGNFHNYLVGDGQVNTNLSVQMGLGLVVANHVVPGGVAISRTLLLDDPAQTSPLEIFLTLGDGTILNSGETFPLVSNQRYVFMALGDVNSSQGQLQPTFLQLNPMAAPPAGEVNFRFTHAMAGSPDPVDVYVNGEIISGLSFGNVSDVHTFSARSSGQDSLLVVPAGEIPNGTNEIWHSINSTLFSAGLDYETILAHVANEGFNGDIGGNAAIYLHEASK